LEKRIALAVLRWLGYVPIFTPFTEYADDFGAPLLKARVGWIVLRLLHKNVHYLVKDLNDIHGPCDVLEMAHSAVVEAVSKVRALNAKNRGNEWVGSKC